jgi:hypothetical protein
MRELLDEYGDNAHEIVRTQRKLAALELSASQMIAMAASENPPKALMAVIDRNAVGGWSGAKQRGPKDEGGGAPCPPDFVRAKEKRNQEQKKKQRGPDRQKPS